MHPSNQFYFIAISFMQLKSPIENLGGVKWRGGGGWSGSNQKWLGGGGHINK